MTRGFVLGLVAVVLLLAGAVWLSASTTFLFRHPKAPHVRIVMDYRTGSAVVAPRVVQPTHADAQPAAQPRAVAPETTHDFGMMNPLTTGRHAFVVRNEGAAPLKLRVGPTTCSKCTVSGVAKKELQPGEETTVSMDWNTGRNPEYAHSAIIYTNDPQRKLLEFTVQGKVRVIVAAEPREIAMPAADPDSPAVADVFIHSQLWSDLEIVEVTSALAGLTWRAEHVEPQVVPHLGSQCVTRLHCEFVNPGAGRFSETLQVSLRESGRETVEQITIPIHGSIKRRLSFYGPSIDSAGTIDLGNIPEGKAQQVKLLAKVRDELRTLDNVEVEVFPDFVAAKWQPHPGGQPGMYQLVLDVPAGIGPCQYKSNPSGRVVIRTSHPRIGEVELGLAFAIVPRSP